MDGVREVIDNLRDPARWGPAEVLALLALLLPIVVGAAAWLRRRARARRERLCFGAELYDAQDFQDAAFCYVRPDSLDENRGGRTELFPRMDQLLDEPRTRYVLLLGESAMGKSSFVLNYYARNRRRGRKDWRRLAIVPLRHPQASAAIQRIPVDDKKEVILFLDAFDEDAANLTDPSGRLKELLKECGEFKKVIVTCRTQFFPSDAEIPQLTDNPWTGARHAGARETYPFVRLYLAAFDDGQIERYLRLRFPFPWRRRKRITASQWVDRIRMADTVEESDHLASRPMLLRHIPDLLARRGGGAGERQPPTTLAEVYEDLIVQWTIRESRNVEEEKSLRAFSERLAVKLYRKEQERRELIVDRAELEADAKAWKIEIPIDRLTGRSLLNRYPAGGFKFAHRSIMEYLCVCALLSNPEDCVGLPLTQQMRHFLVLRAAGEDPRRLTEVASTHGGWERIGDVNVDLDPASEEAVVTIPQPPVVAPPSIGFTVAASDGLFVQSGPTAVVGSAPTCWVDWARGRTFLYFWVSTDFKLAQALVAKCNDGRMLGMADWRLPDLRDALCAGAPRITEVLPLDGNREPAKLVVVGDDFWTTAADELGFSRPTAYDPHRGRITAAPTPGRFHAIDPSAELNCVLVVRGFQDTGALDKVELTLPSRGDEPPPEDPARRAPSVDVPPSGAVSFYDRIKYK